MRRILNNESAFLSRLICDIFLGTLAILGSSLQFYYRNKRVPNTEKHASKSWDEFYVIEHFLRIFFVSDRENKANKARTSIIILRLRCISVNTN